jgi:hypothetical protein
MAARRAAWCVLNSRFINFRVFVRTDPIFFIFRFYYWQTSPSNHQDIVLKCGVCSLAMGSRVFV